MIPGRSESQFADQNDRPTHRRIRTPSTPSSPATRALSLFTPKRWSAMLSARHSTLSNAKDTPSGLHSAEQARHKTPCQISRPFAVCAAPGSALVKTVLAASQTMSADTQDRAEFSSRICERHLAGVPHEQSLLSSSAIWTGKADQTPIGLAAEENQLGIDVGRPEGPLTCQRKAMPPRRGESASELVAGDESDLQVAMDEPSQNSIHIPATELWILGEEQSFSTCPTPGLDQSRSEGISTPALTNDNAHCMTPPTNSLHSHKGNNRQSPGLFDAAEAQAVSPYPISSTTRKDCIVDRPLIDDWGGQPVGTHAEDSVLSDTLRDMLIVREENDRQSRLRAWRRHARYGTPEGDTMDSIASWASSQSATRIATGQVRRRVGMADFLQGRGEDTVSHTLRAEEARETADRVKEQSALGSTTDADSLFENDEERFEIRTAWRGHIPLPPVSSLMSSNETSNEEEDFAASWVGIPDDRPSNIPRRIHPTTQTPDLADQ